MATTSGNSQTNQVPLQTLSPATGTQLNMPPNTGSNVASTTGGHTLVTPGNGTATTGVGNVNSTNAGSNDPLLGKPQLPLPGSMASHSGGRSATSVVIAKLREKFMPTKESGYGRRPRNLTVLLCVYGFIACIIIVFSCAAVPNVASRYVAGIVGFVIVGTLGVRSAIDEWFWDQQYKRSYSRNLGNTVLQTTVACLILVCLYVFRWYPLFQSTHLVLDNDVVPTMDFPSFALLQRLDWSSQAHIYSNDTKCFSRWYDNSAAECPTSDHEENVNLLPQNESCNCKSLWSQGIEEHFMIGDTSYRLLRFGSTSRITASVPDTLLWTQAWFDYNATQAEKDNGWLPQPGISLAIHDPRLSLEQALARNRTRLIDIDASAITSINIAIRLYQSLDGTETYDYDLSISPRTSLKLMCNTGGNGTEFFYNLCATTLQIRIPTFLRTKIMEQPNMDWSKMMVEAGAWFSVAQFVGWTLSGAAFAA